MFRSAAHRPTFPKPSSRDPIVTAAQQQVYAIGKSENPVLQVAATVSLVLLLPSLETAAKAARDHQQMIETGRHTLVDLQTSLKAQQDGLHDMAKLATIYRNPQAASRSLRQMRDAGTRDLAETIVNTPDVLGPLKGGSIFGRKDRAQALAAANDLANAIREASNTAYRISEKDANIRRLEEAPRANETLAASYDALATLESIPWSPTKLRVMAQDLSMKATPDNFNLFGTDVGPDIKRLIVDQIDRRDALAKFTAERDGMNPVDRFVSAASLHNDNLAARNRLSTDRHVLAQGQAVQAGQWAAAAFKETQLAAQQILATPLYQAIAQQRGLSDAIATVNAATIAQQSANQNDNGPEM